MSSDEREATTADLVAAAVHEVPGVGGLHGGVVGEVATYLPGRRVSGVRLFEDGGGDVHVILQWGAPVAATADAVRSAVRALVGGPVHVVVEDVAAP